MREMNLSEMKNTKNNLQRVKMIQTGSSAKLRSEDEMVILAKTARNRFKRSVADGRIEIVSKYEWNLK